MQINLFSTFIYGFTIGSIFYLVSVGLSLTFGYMRIINFAHAFFYAIGAYVYFHLFITLSGNPLFSSAIGVLVATLSALVAYRYVLGRVKDLSTEYTMIVTYAILLIGVDSLKIIWGATPKPLEEPIKIYFNVYDITISLYRVVIATSAVFIHLLLIAILKATAAGRMVIACVDDSELAVSKGISCEKYSAIMYLMGAALSSLGGILYSAITTLYPYMGIDILQLCFAVIVMGGVGAGLLKTINGTFISALILGFIYSLCGSIWGPMSTISVFMTLIVVLLLKPTGIFGSREGA